MPAFKYRQAEEIRDAFARHHVRYLFTGKSGAILLGYPDTTQDVDLFVERDLQNGRALVAVLRELGFALTAPQADEIERGKDFVQLKNGPFDLDLIFRRMGSGDLPMPGRGGSRWRDFPFATLTISSRAKRRPIGRRIVSLCRVCARSANIGLESGACSKPI